MKREAREVANWDFDKIIPCHGVCLFFATFNARTLTLPLGNNREGRKCGLEGSVPMVSRVNPQAPMVGIAEKTMYVDYSMTPTYLVSVFVAKFGSVTWTPVPCSTAVEIQMRSMILITWTL